VRRAFAGISQADLDPFVHLDQMVRSTTARRAQGHAVAPHRGFETVTYMIEGTFLHQDSIAEAA